jgi:hypothetical protein
MSQTVLFAPIHGAALLEMLPIAEKLAEDGRYEPVFFIFRRVSSMRLDYLQNRNFRVIGPKAHYSHNNGKQGKIDASKNGEDKKALSYYFNSWKQKLFTSRFFSFLWYLIRYGFQLLKAKRILKNEQVVLLIVVGDRHVGWETTLIKVAHDFDIPSLIVPFAISDPLSDYRSRLRSPNAKQYKVNSWFRRFLSKCFPNWIYQDGVEKLFFIPPGMALAAKVWDIMPEDPWALGGGAATRMAVESHRVKEMFVEHGVPKNKMIVTGKPSIDQIYAPLKNTDVEKLRRELALSRDQKVLLCSVPQLAEHGLLPWEAHWQEVEFLLATLTAQSNVVVLLSLHPKSDPHHYKPLAEKYGAIIADKPIYSLLPVCDIFVATYSSTVVQAIGIGKPTIVVDFYDLNYTLYDHVPGVVVLRHREELDDTLKKMISDREYYGMLSESQKEISWEWVSLDGNRTQCVVDLIYQMTEV